VSRCERVALAALTGALCLCAQPRTEPDIHYAPGPAQTLDLYIPAKSEFTTIVYTYGGGWHSGNGKSSAPIAVELSRLGYGCVLVSHRLFPPDTFPAPAEDLEAAFAWVKSNIGSRGGDPNKIILAGHSSGAQLSLLIATDPSYLRAWRLNQSDIQAVIGLSSPVDLTRHPDGHGYGDVPLSGHGADPFRARRSVAGGRIPAPATGYGKYYATGFSLNEGRENPGVLWIVSSRVSSSWKAQSYLVLTP